MVNSKKKIPVLIHRGSIVFPANKLEIEVGRKESLNAIQFASDNSLDEIIYISQKDPNVETISVDKVYTIGTLVTFKVVKTWDDGSKRIEITSKERIKISKLTKDKDLFKADYEVMVDISSSKEREKELLGLLVNALDELIVKANLPNAKELKTIFKEIDPKKAVSILATYLPMSLKQRQDILEDNNTTTRLETIYNDLVKDKVAMSVDMKLNDKVNKKLNEQQKEYLLREKLRAIKEELGELNGKDSDIQIIRDRMAKEAFPEHIKKKLTEELNRLEACPPGSQEANVIKTYVDWLVAIPWWKETKDNDELEKAKDILNKNHSGLTKVKERIIEYLAVRTRNKKPKGPIICLVGPPGVGKTSLAKSIAEALNKEYVKISLGGVRDEAEIRGHRKTYLGSQPGRIISSMKRVGVINPLILLDEIDKMSSDGYRGDPASAVLEVLDPEQNNMFSDHYIEEPYDLSNALFLATANYIENIPEPLRDRMEIIQLSSYTEVEKLQIAKDHLIPKIFEELRIKAKELKFADEGILFTIQRYTREAGVRQLERLLNKVVRKFIILQNEKKFTKTYIVNKEKILELLGKEVFDYTMKDKAASVGVVTGLAYTAYGGDILPIEATVFEGKGNISLTGKLGDVMKESATISLGYIKANASLFSLEEVDFSRIDIHIHAPEGAVPKDGPSAGVTLTSALISALSNRKVEPTIGMTGEITLRGLVLKIGGLKEKLISAYRSGVTTTFIPADNVKDLDEVPEIVKNNIKIIPVTKYEEIYKVLFSGKTSAPKFTKESFRKIAKMEKNYLA